MNKILLIIQREYFSRVKKKSFLLLTFLVPIFFIALYAGVIYLTKKSFEDSHATVLVVDEQGTVGKQLENTKHVTFSHSNKELQQQISELKNSENTSILVIPKDFFESRTSEFISSGKPNITVRNNVEASLSDIVKNYRFNEMGINLKSINDIKSDVNLKTKEVTETGDAKDSDTRIAMGVAMALSVLVYISLVLYGSQVMRGIIEEKSSRIVEVIISSVKPFQLMVGKIVGIGLVGLTQFVLWAVLSAGLLTLVGNIVGQDRELTEQIIPEEQADQAAPVGGFDFNVAMQSIDFPELLICFFVFFLGGYLLYSALFAAIGSAVDNETEAGQMTMPITMPLLLTYVLSFGVIVNDPHGTIATWLSFIPLTSPIAMLVRIPFDVPLWQIVLSIVLLIAGFLLATWVAARIYRVGILMYGKKISVKELIKWFNYKS